jgi:hypothetical protein
MPGQPVPISRDVGMSALDARIDALVASQSAFFASGETLGREFRTRQLDALDHAIRKH